MKVSTRKVLLLMLTASVFAFVIYQEIVKELVHVVKTPKIDRADVIGKEAEMTATRGEDVAEMITVQNEKVEMDPKLMNASDRYAKILGCRKLPDVLIIGFEKCGTITLKTYLGIHPQLHIQGVRVSVQLFNKMSRISVEEYAKHITCTPGGKLRLDKISPDGRANNTYKIIPNAKLIAIVKEPVERAMSHYVHRVATGLEKDTSNFDSVVASLMDDDLPKPKKGKVLFRQSQFIDRLEPWIAKYGLDKIHVVDGDNFVKNPTQELQKVETFLGLKPFISEENFVYDHEKGFYCLKQKGIETCMKKDKGRPHPVMSNSTRSRLQNLFRPYNEKLFVTLGRNFSWNY